MGEIIANIHRSIFCTKFCFFSSSCNPTWHILLNCGLYLEIDLFIKLDQTFICIISCGRGME